MKGNTRPEEELLLLRQEIWENTLKIARNCTMLRKYPVPQHGHKTHAIKRHSLLSMLGDLPFTKDEEKHDKQTLYVKTLVF